MSNDGFEIKQENGEYNDEQISQSDTIHKDYTRIENELNMDNVKVKSYVFEFENRNDTRDTVQNDRKKSFQCTICISGFSQSDDLFIHLKFVHERKKPFLCAYCMVGFAKSPALIYHIEKFHSVSEEKNDEFITGDNNPQFTISNVVSITEDQNTYKQIERIKNEQIDHDMNCDDTKSDDNPHIRHHEENIDPISLIENLDSIEDCNVRENFEEKNNLVKNDVLIIEESVDGNNISLVPDGKEDELWGVAITKKHKCFICNYEFLLKSLLNQHVLRTHGGYPCLVCELKFKKNSELAIHMKSDHKKDKKSKEHKPHQCPQCDAKFKHRNSLKDHVVGVHEGKRPYLCSICGADYTQKANLRRHIDQVHEKTKRFTCALCDRAFGRKIHMEEHVSKVHEGIKFQCSMCDAKYSHKPNLEGHIALVHEKKKVNHCTICDTSFTTKSYLTKHLAQVHEKKSKVSCTLCDAVLGNKDSLKAHIESIHEGKRHVCDICGHSAAYSQSLREHIKIVHEGKKIVKKKYNRPPKICSVCQKSFRDSYKLKMHIRSVHKNQSV